MAGMFGIDLSAVPADLLASVKSIPQGIAGDLSHILASPTAAAGQTATSPGLVGSVGAAAPPAAQGIAAAPPIPDATIAPIIPIAPAQAQLTPSQGVAPRPVGPLNLGPGLGGADHMTTLGQFHSLMQQISPGWGQQ